MKIPTPRHLPNLGHTVTREQLTKESHIKVESSQQIGGNTNFMKKQGNKPPQIAHSTSDPTNTTVEEIPEREFRKLIN